jgi:putative copper export protein
LSADELLAFVKSEAKRFDRQILLRDLREVIAGVLAIALIAPTAVRANLLTRLGTVVVIAALVFIVVRLTRARRESRGDAMDRPVALVLRAEQAKIDTQIRLLETVFWWYVGPLWLGMVMIIAGRDGISWLTLVLVAALTALSVALLRVNAHAARRYLRPRRDRLAQLLGDVDLRDASDG